jgi:hypothetical protein
MSIPLASKPLTLLVHPTFGPYKTIQAAIDVSRDNDVIKIAEGIYLESIVIT